MKKLFIGIILLVLPVFIASFILPNEKRAYAEGSQDESIEEIVDQLLNETDLDTFQSVIDSLNTGDSYSVRELLYDVLHNEVKPDFSFFLSYIIKCALGDGKKLFSEMLLILSIVVLLSIMQNLTSSFSKTSTKKIVYVACYGLIVTIIGIALNDVITSTITVIHDVSRFSEAVFPILLTLISSIGSTTSASIYQPLLLVFSQIIVKITEYIILPTFYIGFVFAIVGNISEEIRLEKFSSLAKTVGNWIIGITFGLFITYTTVRGITGASMDSLAAKGAKYALENYVPVIGSYLKDGFDLITAGCIVIKNSLGLVAVILLLLYALNPIVKLLITSLAFKLTSAVCEPFGEKKISNVLSSISKNLSTPIIACVALTFTIILFLCLIILTCNGGML